ncbi:hypothetical protein C8Q70DRAFT_307443 [Cubamyces menziesii]|nr:hypothetical protein C8Q70DRAFT_307443 [Cubamyces menziesii]
MHRSDIVCAWTRERRDARTQNAEADTATSTRLDGGPGNARRYTYEACDWFLRLHPARGWLCINTGELLRRTGEEGLGEIPRPSREGAPRLAGAHAEHWRSIVELSDGAESGVCTVSPLRSFQPPPLADGQRSHRRPWCKTAARAQNTRPTLWRRALGRLGLQSAPPERTFSSNRRR